MKKDLCFFIFSVGKANGGHYRSLATTAEAMSENYNVKIIVLGYTYSHIIKDLSIPSHFIYFNGLNVLSTLNKASSLINKDMILHAFDTYSYFIVRLLNIRFKNKIALTKCGGTNPKGFFTKTENLIVFSQENYTFFKGEKKWKSSNIELIPNRTKVFDSNIEKIITLKSRFELDKFDKIILRISRIDRFHNESINQSINLQKLLSDNGFKSALLIIGNIQDAKVLESLNAIDIENVFFVTDDEFTLNAKELIEIADWVVGTGRGFMEACSKSKVMFAVSPNENVPMLISNENFDFAFKYNFSNRSVFTKYQIEQNQNNIISLFNNKEKEDKLKLQSLAWFEEYFSEQNLITKYTRFYEELLITQSSKIDLLQHWIYFIKNNLGTWYRNIRKQWKKN